MTSEEKEQMEAAMASIPRLRLLRRVVPVNQSQTRESTRLTVISLELYDDAFMLNSALRNLDVQDETSIVERMFPGFPQVVWEAEDDRGVKYYSSPGGGGGGGAEFRFESVFAPAIPDEAKQLVLTCPEIQWMADGPGARSRIEFGPWRFEIPLT